MKKQLLLPDEAAPIKAPRADRPPTKGFVTVVDGHSSRRSTPSKRPKHRPEI